VSSAAGGAATRRVAVVAFDGISPFHLSVPCLVFGDVTNQVVPAAYDVVVCAEGTGSTRTSAGFSIDVRRGLAALRTADLVVLPSWDVERTASPRLRREIARAHERGAVVLALCLGTFLAMEAGLGDGLEVVTHWRHADELQRRHPGARVRADLLWSDTGSLVTSAGTAASLDCCLHVVRRQHGAQVASRVARGLVLAPHRTGNQALFVPVPVPQEADDDPVARAMVWARERLAEPIDLDAWGRAVHLSRRSFTRHFRARTGTSPLQWLTAQRLDHARLLLEGTSLPVERVAAESGFGSAASLREHFARALGTSPARHRAQFAEGDPLGAVPA
jgi:transcriptional regulator GlxA family with amidase domain